MMKDEITIKKLDLISRFIAVGVLVISGALLVGRLMDWKFLIQLFPVNPIGSIQFLLLSCIILWRNAFFSFRYFNVLIFFLFGLSLYILLDKVFHFEWHLDTLFFREQMIRTARTNNFTRIGMSLSTALCFAFTISSIALIPQHRSLFSHLRQMLNLTVFLISVAVLVFYLFRVPEVGPYFLMAPLTAILFVALSISFVLIKPQNGFIKHLVVGPFSHSYARILVPLAVVFPITLGYLRLYGAWHHVISTELGVSFITLAFVLTFLLTTWVIARSFNRRMKLTYQYQLQANDLLTANEELQSTTEELTSNIEALAESNRALERANETIASQKDEQLNRVLDFTNDVIWSFDLTGKGQNYLSRSAERVYQQPYNELIVRPYFWTENVHPDDRQKVNESNQTLKIGGQSECTYRLLLNGKIHWFHNECRLVKNENGTPLRIEGLASDITRQKLQQEELESSRLQLASIITNSNDNFVLLDEHAQIVFFNNGYRQFVKRFLGKELAIGMSLFEAVPADRVEANRGGFIQALAGETVNKVAETHHEGEKHFFNIRYGPVVEDGRVTHVTLSAFEITSQKKQEEIVEQYKRNLEIIFNRTHDVFILLDANLNTLQFNKAAFNLSYELAGVPLEVGTKYLDSAPPFRRAELEQVMRQVLAGESVTLTTDFPGISGQRIQYKVVYEPVFTEGKVTHISVGGIDISEIKHQEKKAEEYRQNLEIVFENTTDHFALLNTKAEIIILNQPLANYIRKYATVPPVAGTSFYDIVAPNRKEVARNLIERALRGERSHVVSESVFQNETKYFSVIYSPVIKDGAVKYITITSTDITEEKIKEREIEKYRANLDVLFKTTKDTIILITADRKVELFNNAFEEFIKEVAGTTPKIGIDFLDLIVPQKREMAAQLFEKTLRGEVSIVNAQLPLKRGTIHNYVRYEPIYQNGKVTHVSITGTDITEQVRKDEEIEKYRSDLDAIFKTTKDTILMMTAEGKVEVFNQAFVDFIKDATGIQPTIGCHFLDVVAPHRRAAATQLFNKALQGKITNTDAEFTSSTGKTLWHYLSYAPIVRDGKVTHVSVIGRDVTTLKEIEEELKKDQYFLEKASESARIGYWTSEPDHEHGKLTWSKEVFKIFGVKEENFKGTNREFFERVHSEDLPRVMELSRQALVNGTAYDIDHRIVMPDGSLRWVNEKAQIIRNDKNNPMLMVGVVQDINDRKMIESVLRQYNERFEVLSKATNDAIWDWDVERNVETWNHGLETIFGYEQQEISNATQWWAEKVHPEDYHRVITELNQVMAKRESNWAAEYRYKCANGSYKNVLDRAYVMYAGGKPTRLIGAMQDITEVTEYRLSLERKVEERTEELQAALAKEKELVEMQKRFISIASHEFRTPLSTISLASGFIKKFHQKLTTEDIHKRIDSIDTQVVRMNELLQDVLTISKIDAGKDETHWKDIPLKEIIESIVTEVANSTQGSHQINFNWRCRRHQFLSDEGKIRTILINLLNNAIKFSKQEIDLDVSCTQNELVLRVKDYGVGIPQQELGKLFQPFYRASNVSFINGTGLGLSIVAKAVERLGGKIEVQSELSKGTEFTVKLPIA